ncbi:hypothetical protein QJS10_CPA03g02169 [Acorus calamus]|uniref:RPN1 N-terminal domain-containing protein n=1 Tax=Acorus calamus TaxID=4465 RepID=A0AAV9FB41_ACOCL|nr:hypothetical protein QJS10_CPA03g02169 [Acorus calamus]
MKELSLDLSSMNVVQKYKKMPLFNYVKPFKYLKPHYPFLCAIFEKLTKDSDTQKKFVDILSVLAIIMDMRDHEYFVRHVDELSICQNLNGNM